MHTVLITAALLIFHYSFHCLGESNETVPGNDTLTGNYRLMSVWFCEFVQRNLNYTIVIWGGGRRQPTLGLLSFSKVHRCTCASDFFSRAWAGVAPEEEGFAPSPSGTGLFRDKLSVVYI